MLPTNRTMPLLQVACLLIPAFARSLQAYLLWQREPNSRIARPFQRYTSFPSSFTPSEPYNPLKNPGHPETRSFPVSDVVFFCTLFTVVPCLVCGCSYIKWRRRYRRQILRNRGREPSASSLARAALPYRRSSVGFNNVAHSSIRSETGSSPHVLNLDSTHTEFHPSAPPSPADFEALHEEQHLTSFKMKAEKANDPCGICLEPFSLVDVTAGQCLHVFHTACLRAWLAKESSQKLCPLCRNPFHDTFDT